MTFDPALRGSKVTLQFVRLHQVHVHGPCLLLSFISHLKTCTYDAITACCQFTYSVVLSHLHVHVHVHVHMKVQPFLFVGVYSSGQSSQHTHPAKLLQQASRARPLRLTDTGTGTKAELYISEQVHCRAESIKLDPPSHGVRVVCECTVEQSLSSYRPSLTRCACCVRRKVEHTSSSPCKYHSLHVRECLDRQSRFCFTVHLLTDRLSLRLHTF